MYYISPNKLPTAKIDIPKYDAYGIKDDYFILKPSDEDLEFDSKDLDQRERGLAENYIPPIIALIAVKGSDMYTAFSLNSGTMKAIIDEERYLVTLMADNFTNSNSQYFAAGLAKM
ncbi:hypothetical protein GCM10008959_38750 [Deinococcus seoulensis]|uniref:Uncharacterized protein n=1 Tax=Deinococcus seoulensis TaxID=1837379 RepID=A0ABQ2S0P1_9DEIO|nr:hypothetical protein [Deinococcus seoulensis]GGR73695.1 hypothetical protein GCM10008959_38750 [Deinococcus seoulensis]